ncbi:uncharacterized protein LOC136034194 [Artemia franciscana]|uniref:uncharacterized protein LOC136034194 n=1 Tax=Artemia franciscana TaxID=6661 RepID=UPI0032D9BC9A
MKLYCLLFISSYFLSEAAPQGTDGGVKRTDRNPYQYEWEVKSEFDNLYYGAAERSEGETKTVGKYYVLLPNNRVMLVEYSVEDDSGFLPRITMLPSPFAAS